jgi:hypothetical protein
VWDPKAIELAQANSKPITAGSDVHSTVIFGGGVLSDHELNGPQDYISLILGSDMYLLTDGVCVRDRYGNVID